MKPLYSIAAEDLRGNPEQWRAYESKSNSVILAGPGSGKTKTLTVKIARMLAEDVRHPRGIACITYNNECAGELRKRLETLGVRQSQSLFIGTVHSFCLKHVLQPYARLAGVRLPHRIVVALQPEQERCFEEAFTEVYGGTVPANWRTDFDLYRRTHVDRADLSWRRDDDEMAEHIENYEGRLRASGLVDFDDMMLLGLRLIQQHEWIGACLKAKFPILAVDEYQDLGLALHEIVKQLCFVEGVRLFAVGDPDQSIYAFAGAKPELLRELSARENVEAIQLRFNYRSGQKLIDASEVALGEARGYKAHAADSGGTIDFHKCVEGIEQQAQVICSKIIPGTLANRQNRRIGDVAVLYLDRYDGDIIEEAVKAAKLKFIRVDRGAPYAKTPLTRWIEECAAWCAGGWMKGTSHLSGLVRSWEAFNHSTRADVGIHALRTGLVTFLFRNRTETERASAWLNRLHDEQLVRLFQREASMRDEAAAVKILRHACSDSGKLKELTVTALGGQSGSPDHLNLITLHSAKGLEFDSVVLMGMDQGRIPSWSATTAEKKREPRRVFYVGLTRARHEVHMTYSGFTVNRRGQRFDKGPSEFMIEVARRLKR